MEINDELKEINDKNCMCQYFYHIIKTEGFNLDNVLINENHTKVFYFKKFHTKL